MRKNGKTASEQPPVSSMNGQECRLHAQGMEYCIYPGTNLRHLIYPCKEGGFVIRFLVSPNREDTGSHRLICMSCYCLGDDAGSSTWYRMMNLGKLLDI